jgi:hypothetical protein
MVCEHLRPLEERIIARGFVESQRGRPRSTTCREWVTYNCDARVIAKLEGMNIPACVKHYEQSYAHRGSESGLLCDEHSDALISGVLRGPDVPAFLGIESMASPDGLLEAAYLVWGDYDRGPIYRSPRIIRIATSEILVDLWDSSWSGTVRFEGAANVAIRLSRYPDDILLHIDVSAKTFAFSQTPNQREPLTSLPGRLEPLLPQPTRYIAPIRSSSAGQRLLGAFYADGQSCFRSGSGVDHRNSAARGADRRGVGRGNFLWRVRRFCGQRSKKKEATGLMAARNVDRLSE